jgi:RimJ/RimL family protein N-acetyltransferase
MTDAVVTLRSRTDADLDALYEIAADLSTWERRQDSAPTTLTRATWDAGLARRDESGLPAFVIDVDGSAVGSCSLFGFDELARHAEVGIALAAGARGRGLGTAALRQLVEFGFVRRNLRRLHLGTIGSNEAALRCYEKVGFVVEGRQREHVWDAGRWVDFVRMGLLRSEWTGGSG